MSVLTRMVLNPATRGGRNLLFNRQAMHAAVMAAYSPDTHASMQGRPLWRVDQDGQRHTLYLVGPREPDLTHVVEQAGWAGEGWSSVDYSPFLSRLRRGQQWGFRLTANPVHSVSSGSGKRGKILPHVTPAQQTQWLKERSSRWGFSLMDQEGQPVEDGQDSPLLVTVTARRDERFGRRAEGEERQKVTLRMAQFDGALQIEDPERLRTALTAGMGRAKAYGCGLMTLRPLSERS
ncbi:type I-E CRISPR-associated protein Cas6/Cse3/CasE [Micrococcus sp.]|uniref:type I-E CRISPR-associated protein Cas6/Cse3/CasE n=1 Tax=Micrococcus sp. TaxID=1271 RepID=UPI002A91BEDF|nr:type I-E CRISPR-associated protein Cas6/Cse3/CasE [Micrococcus sp.]MDY6054508.1 type I-E CRISPR-associated protein Cas6/Cse3/CasE [Micrococcus sp.]